MICSNRYCSNNMLRRMLFLNKSMASPYRKPFKSRLLPENFKANYVIMNLYSCSRNNYIFSKNVSDKYNLVKLSDHAIPISTQSHSDTTITWYKNVVTEIHKSPYVRLMRIDRPIGTWLLYWPCAWSISLSAPAGSFPDFYLLSVFAIGAFIMRGAGCTINDMWDKDIDAKVQRTRSRPLVSGELTTFDALIFLIGQLGIGCAVLLQLNMYSIVLGASSLGLVVIYPLMKRITYWPQLVLGMTFNWGALLGWASVEGSVNWHACLPLYLAGICWTIIYDTIYAHQDRIDDIMLGIKSTAIRFKGDTKLFLSGFASAMMAGLVTSGLACDQSLPYYATVGLVAAHITRQIYKLDINNSSDCATKFISNHQIGLLLFCGIILGTLMKNRKSNNDSSIVPIKESINNVV